MIRLAFAYLKYYKKQTAALLAGIMLSAALLAGMGGLMESGRQAAAQNARLEYGDWHYCLRGEEAYAGSLANGSLKKDGYAGAGYLLERAGKLSIIKTLKKPFSIQIAYADDVYLQMMGRRMLKGHYPENADEAALDVQVLNSLGCDAKLGEAVVLDGVRFTLCGIVSDMPAKLPEIEGEFGQVFVSSAWEQTELVCLYLKFEESGKAYRQLFLFCKEYGIELSRVRRNNGLADYVDGEAPSSVLGAVRTGFSHQEAGFPYIWAQLNTGGRLLQAAVLVALAIFGAFVVYSLFQISVSRRMSQYSMMQAVGMTDGYAAAVLLLELFFVFLPGYPAGCAAGSLFAFWIYKKAGRIFVLHGHTAHTGGIEDMRQNAVASLPDAGDFKISFQAAFFGAFFFAVVFCMISYGLVRRMRRYSIRQMMAMDTKKHQPRRIYSKMRRNLTGVITHKFMLGRKGTFAGILLSLSVGSVIFLGAYYVAENTKNQNELAYKADDGLGSDIQVYVQSDSLSDTIPKETTEQMAQVAGVASLHPVRYMLGEVTLEDGKLVWDTYFAEIANEPGFLPDPVLMEKYNGVAVRTGKDDYTLKVNIYGYDDEMLKELGDYLLEGEIDPDTMRRENSVIFKTIMGGQGTYEGIDVHTGEKIPFRTPRSSSLPQEALRFQGKEGWYEKRSMKIAAVAKRPLAKVEAFIGDHGDDVVDLIMTNEQMEQNFGVSGYRTASISIGQGEEAKAAPAALGKLASRIPGCVVKDYSAQIKAQDLYLAQKMVFYYGIAGVLLAISLLHIQNSMRYLVFARRREFGIMRAMGITDTGFCRMLAAEGLKYGIYSGLAVFAVYLPVQKVLYYFMVRVYLYLHPSGFISWEALAFVLAANLMLCIGMALFAGRALLREEPAEQM